MSFDAPPLILTLKLDPPSFNYLDGLRRAHFPPERNLIPAHITLFHALPGDQHAAIVQTLDEICATTATLDLSMAGLRFLGRGVALEVESPALLQLRQTLAQRWAGWLSAQDRQRYRPHITIQNKVAPDAARQLYAELAQSWTPLTARGQGLLLWHYLGGPWQLAHESSFLDAAD